MAVEADRATPALGTKCKQSRGLESLETRKKIVSQVPDLTAVTCKRVFCVNVEHEVVVLGGDLQCGFLRDASKILKIVFCITVFICTVTRWG